MSFPAYPAYKKSGVEWLGVVPDHWTVTLLKRGYEVVLGKMLQPEARRDDDEFLPYLRAANIQLSGVDTADVKRMWFGAEEKKSLLLRRGDLLVSEGGDVGRSAIWEFDQEECYFQNSINRIRSIGGNNTRFLYFWMIAIKENGYVDVLCNKSTIAHFTAEKVAAVPLPIPTKTEQAQIARFLDHETTRIGALIEEQQRLIELLKEKRQAVISHAVTKGLNPTAPMKDSGVEWLGEVPAHWDVSRLKYHSSRIGDGLHSTPEYDDAGDYFFINGNNLVGGSICITATTRQVNFQGFVKHRVLLDSSTVLISINGTIGNLALYSGEPVILGKSAAYINCAKSLSPRFCLYLFSSGQIRRFFESQLTGTTIYNLSLRTIAETPTPLPSIDEQNCIVEFLSRQVDEFDELIDNAMRLSQLLQERRSALISAAVTGKIDVRGWQTPVSTQAPKFEVAEAV
nr:restriction endonuclease subunit S [uncultured Pseudomonas sp.]